MATTASPPTPATTTRVWFDDLLCKVKLSVGSVLSLKNLAKNKLLSYLNSCGILHQAVSEPLTGVLICRYKCNKSLLARWLIG